MPSYSLLNNLPNLPNLPTSFQKKEKGKKSHIYGNQQRYAAASDDGSVGTVDELCKANRTACVSRTGLRLVQRRGRWKKYASA